MKHSIAHSGQGSTASTPFKEAMDRLGAAYGALLGFELMLEQIDDFGRDMNGYVLAELIHPHIRALDTAMDELRSFDSSKNHSSTK